MRQLKQEKQRHIELLKKKIPATEKSLNEATQELEKVKYESAQLISEIRKKRATVEETRSSLQASKSRGRVLDSLMQQKREGKCPGLFGRLVSNNNIILAINLWVPLFDSKHWFRFVLSLTDIVESLVSFSNVFLREI